MNELSSSKFRMTFHRLDGPTLVTVNGHAIGTYLPGFVPEDNPWFATYFGSENRASADVTYTEIGTPGRPDLTTETRGTDPVLGSFGASRPAPKPAGRKR